MGGNYFRKAAYAALALTMTFSSNYSNFGCNKSSAKSSANNASYYVSGENYVGREAEPTNLALEAKMHKLMAACPGLKVERKKDGSVSSILPRNIAITNDLRKGHKNNSNIYPLNRVLPLLEEDDEVIVLLNYADSCFKSKKWAREQFINELGCNASSALEYVDLPKLKIVYSIHDKKSKENCNIENSVDTNYADLVLFVPYAVAKKVGEKYQPASIDTIFH